MVKRDVKSISIFFILLLLIIPFAFAQDEAPQLDSSSSSDSPSPDISSDSQPQQTPPDSSTQEQPTQEIPQGCESKQSDSGINSLDCNIDKQEFKDFDIKDEIKSCDGEFKMIDGAPACIKEGSQGFGSTECPSESELNSMKSKCKGTIETFKDERGCHAVMCINKDFKEQYDKKIQEKYKDNPLKEQAIRCSKDGGKFVLVQGKGECIEQFKDDIQIKDQITKDDIDKAFSKLDKLENNIEKITDKLDSLPDDALANEAKQRLGDSVEKISSLKEKLEKTELSDAERTEILVEVKAIQKSVLEVTEGIVEGRIPDESNKLNQTFEQYSQFYGQPFATEDELDNLIEREKDAIETVKACAKYAEIKTFVPPEPPSNRNAVSVDIIFKNNICELTIYLKTGNSATFLVPEDVLASFNGPEKLIGLQCSGACDTIKQLVSGPHAEGEGVECMEQCVYKDCSLTQAECFKQNREKCESECGMKKGPEAGNQEQQCIRDCVGPGVMCQPGEGGEQNPKCTSCAEKCASQYYEGPCLSHEKLKEKQSACETCEHCYGEPTMGDSGEGYQCITGVECKDATSEFGDNPGAGQDTSSSESSSGGESGGETSSVTGGVITTIAKPFLGFFSWLKKLFGFGKDSVSGVSGDKDTEALTQDLINLNKDLKGLEEDIS